MTVGWTESVASRVDPAIAAEIGRFPAFAELVAAIVARGAAAHPSRRVTAASWVSFFALHLRDGEIAQQLTELHAEDVHLILACLAGDSRAHGELDARLLATSRQAFAGKRMSPEDEEDVLQTVRAKLLVGDSVDEVGKLASYSGKGPLDGWLRVTLTREAISKLRSHATDASRISSPPIGQDGHEDHETLDHAALDDPELAVLRARYGTALKRALDASLAALPADDRQLVREHYFEGLTIDDLAAVYATHRATAARRLARARHKVFEGARLRLMDTLGVGATEFASLLGVLVSNLDWTMRAALDGSNAARTVTDETPAVVIPAALSSASLVIDAEEPPLEELGVAVVVAGRFELVRFLGAGATAIVWEAARTGGLAPESGDDHVALKFARNDSAEFVQRFEREATIAAALVHPNVARTFEVLPATSGRGPCLVQELVQGDTLEAQLNVRGLVTPREAAHLALPVLSALIAAHARGIVHRDLKPQNIVVDGDRVVVLDFGIAKLLPTFGEHARLTRSGAIMGTPRYMAPEQLGGERDIDARADVWAFGALLFRMLTGRPPIDATSVGEAWRELHKGAIRTIDSIIPSAPKDICTLVQSALVIERNERLPSLAPFVPLLRSYAGDAS